MDARAAVRLPAHLTAWFRQELARQIPGRPWYTYIRCIERRFFGSAISPRGFFQLKFDLRETALPEPTGGMGVIDAFRETPIRIGDTKSEISIEMSGYLLAKYIEKVTTRIDAASAKGPRWGVTAGRPLYVLTASTEELAQPHSDSRSRIDAGAAQLFYEFRVHADCWIVVAPQNTRNIHEYALHLSRLHSERVTLSAVANHIARSPNYNARLDLDKNKVEQVISETSKYLSREFSFGKDQKVLIEAAESELQLHAAEWSALESAFKTMRRSTQSKVSTVINIINHGNGRQSMGDIISGNQNSTIINRSSVLQSLNKLRSEEDQSIATAVEDLTQALADNDNKEVTDVAEGLIEELAGKRRESILLSLWEKLRIIAPVVGSVASVSAAIAKLTGH